METVKKACRLKWFQVLYPTVPIEVGERIEVGGRLVFVTESELLPRLTDRERRLSEMLDDALDEFAMAHA